MCEMILATHFTKATQGNFMVMTFYFKLANS